MRGELAEGVKALPGNEQITELINRMKRIEGQARGIQRMLQEGQECEDIVIQLSAMKAALNRVGLSLITCHLSERLERDLNDGEPSAQAVEKALKILSRL